MSTSFGSIGITTLVGVNRMVCNKLNVFFVESKQRLGQGENRMLIDRFMCQESPIGDSRLVFYCDFKRAIVRNCMGEGVC